MNKSEFISAMIAKTGGSKKDAEANLNAVLDVLAEALEKKEKVQFVGFGTFETRERAARTGKNPQTGEAIKIAAATVPAFKAGKALKDKVNK